MKFVKKRHWNYFGGREFLKISVGLWEEELSIVYDFMKENKLSNESIYQLALLILDNSTLSNVYDKEDMEDIGILMGLVETHLVFHAFEVK